MKSSTILPQVTVRLRTETFDPKNAEHIKAFVMLTQQGKQHPELRFVLEHPYLDVRAMMYDKVGRAYVEQFNKSLEAFRHLVPAQPIVYAV